MDIHTCISYWPFLDRLESSFVVKIRWLIVISVNYDLNNIGLLTIDDEDRVFGYSDCDTMRLFGGNKQSKQPTEIVELSGKQVIEVQFGHGHLIALTRGGQVYAWGKNDFGQVGIGTKVTCLKPALLDFGNNQIEMIKCGWGRNLAITNTGQVFAWGANDIYQSGVGNTNGQLVPTKMTSLEHFVVVNVECGYSHSMALTEDGQIYSWGWNDSGQLGLGDRQKRTVPTKVIIDGDENIKVKSIACRSNHSLVLTEDGHIYGCGFNDYGQVGCGSTNIVLSLVKINCNEQFRQIATLQHQSVALAESGFCYVWGRLKTDDVDGQKTPQKTNLSTIEHVFGMYLYERCISQLIPIRQFHHRYEPTSPLLDKLVESFNQPELSDLQFVVDGKTIYVHRLLLQYTSQYYNRMLSDLWLDTDRIELSRIGDPDDSSNPNNLTGYCYSVHLAHLRYLYTGRFEVSNIDEVIQLLDLSTSYLEPELQNQCVKYLETCLTVNNCCTLYQLSDLYKLDKFKENVSTFIYGNLSDVVCTEEFKLFDANLFKNLMQNYSSKSSLLSKQ